MKFLVVFFSLAFASFASGGLEIPREPPDPESDYFFGGVLGLLYLFMVIFNIIHSLFDRNWKLFSIYFVPSIITLYDLWLILFSYGTFSYMFHKTAILVFVTNLISWGIVELVLYTRLKIATRSIDPNPNENRIQKTDQQNQEQFVDMMSNNDYKDLRWEYGIDPTRDEKNK